MKPLSLWAFAASFSNALAADKLPSLSTYKTVHGDTKNGVLVDPAKDLPRYPAVEPRDAITTWKIKPGFKLQLAAHEPQVRDPIAVCFDENGRMFVCEMNDYSEMRDVTPHLGRISVLEDKDGDGYFETSKVFADDLPWPTGVIWANGGLYAGATPDIWRFEDRDGDGRAEFREKVYTGFGTGLKLLNVQGLMNSFQWGQDNRIHILAGGGNRGEVMCLKRPELPALELAGRDFWFDPLTHEFGLEGGGAQYGMSFDNYGRKFGCSNSDHLQFWVYDDQYVGRNPYFSMPSSRRSIAADGGAAEVFRISPDEPWRIMRTRWRVAGVVKGAVEGGGRVSGYFTGASGTTVYRGDAYGADFVNNTFSGDAGGQLVHRKKIFTDGVSLVGKRPDDEQGVEFAASKDTWVRVVNLANAPDGCLHICDMYREVIEHPWSIPDEIKKHIDLNSGNDRGRIYRIVPDKSDWRRRSKTELGKASVAELVKTLKHPNGWHRDTASRLLYERQNKTAVPLLTKMMGETTAPLAKLHALGVLAGLDALTEGEVLNALGDHDPHVRERGIAFAEKLVTKDKLSTELVNMLTSLVNDGDERVRFQLALTLNAAPKPQAGDSASAALVQLAQKDFADPWISAALLNGTPDRVVGMLFGPLTSDAAMANKAAAFVARLIEVRAASKPMDAGALIDFLTQREPNAAWVRAFGDGLRRRGATIAKVDTGNKLAALFNTASTTATAVEAPIEKRLDAIELLGLAPAKQAVAALAACIAEGQPEAIQLGAIRTLAQSLSAEVPGTLLDGWADFGVKAKEATLNALLMQEDRAQALLAAVQAGSVAPGALSAGQVQSLVQHKSPRVAALAKTALATVMPAPRAEVLAKFQPALTTMGDARHGAEHFRSRCMVCHRAGGEGFGVGPDLITVKTKGRDALLTAIIEPHKEVASQFIAYTVNTKEDQTLIGLITQDDASSLTVKMMGGTEIIVPRANVKGSSSSGQSLMPEGLEAGLEIQDMADLLSFIEGLK